MNKILLLLTIAFITNRAIAQQIHSPAEILKIMEKSKLMFNIKKLDKPISIKDRSQILNSHDVYRVSSDSGISTYNYKLTDKAKLPFNKAEGFFQAKNLDSALFYYKKTLEADPSIYKVMTYIGQIYDDKRDYAQSAIWYQRTITRNYIDYMAHWFLADIYKSSGKIKEAVDEITIAHILNRNNPRIKESMTTIYKLAKIKGDDWTFNPQMEIIKEEGNKISLSSDEKWMGYAFTKALWLYDIDYKKSMGVAEKQYSLLEDRESLAVLYMALKNSKTSMNKTPEFKILEKTIDQKFLDEYIFYEILLTERPFIAYQLPENQIKRIKDYLLTVRFAN